MKKNTIGYWLNTIQDNEARINAIKYAVKYAESVLETYSPSLADSIHKGFVWDETKEGLDFWHNMYKSLSEKEKTKMELTNMTAQFLIGAKIINAGYNKLYLDNGTEIELSPEEIDHLNTCSDNDYIGGFTPVIDEKHLTDTSEQMPFLKAVLDDVNISDEFKSALTSERNQ